MELLNGLVETINEYLWGYILIVMLISIGIYFTFKTKFVQFRLIREMFRLLGDGIDSGKKQEGKISSFQAFCISTASRVGTGNIAGIAIAIVTGGPGAIFWMWRALPDRWHPSSLASAPSAKETGTAALRFTAAPQVTSGNW